MSLDKEHTILFSLLRSGLWEKEIETTAPFPLSDEGWKTVLALARRQTVTGIACQGLNYLPDAFLPADAIMFRWITEVDRIERINRAMNETIHELFDLFSSYALHPVLLKGQGTACMYARPLLREAGDIDLYFPTHEEWSHAGKIMKERKVAFLRLPDGSLCYRWNGIEVEHHATLFDLHSPFLKKYLKELEELHGFTEQAISPATTVKIPSPALHLLLLNTHILKHAVGQGVGMRQLCDMARVYHHLHNCIDATEMKSIYRRTGLTRWSRLLHAFIVEKLGMPADKLPYLDEAVSPRPLSDLILAGGNFGQYRRNGDRQTQHAWKRKLRTAGSFLQNLRFSSRYAPGETFWTCTNLFKGQFKC